MGAVSFLLRAFICRKSTLKVLEVLICSRINILLILTRKSNHVESPALTTKDRKKKIDGRGEICSRFVPFFVDFKAN